MIGDDRARSCLKCAKSVFNLSAMTAEEAEALLERNGESICVRLYRRKDGTILTADCDVGVRRKRLRVLAAMTLGLGSGIAAAWSPHAKPGEPWRMAPARSQRVHDEPTLPPPPCDTGHRPQGGWTMGAVGGSGPLRR